MWYKLARQTFKQLLQGGKAHWDRKTPTYHASKWSISDSAPKMQNMVFGLYESRQT